MPAPPINTRKNMEQINKVELLGIIGNAHTQTVGDKKVAKFTFATNRAYKDRTGMPVIETTWHNVTAWEGARIPYETLAQIEKGATAHVLGRIKQTTYMGTDGSPRYVTEIVANSLKIIPCASMEEPTQPEM